MLYLHFLLQVCGAGFISFVAFGACLWNQMPVQQYILVSVGVVAGLCMSVPGAWLAFLRLPTGKSLLGGGMVFLFLSLVSLMFHSPPEKWFGAPTNGSMGGLVVCATLLIVFAAISHGMASQSTSVLSCLLGLYLLRLVLPGLSSTRQIYCLMAATLLFLFWMTLWMSRRQPLFFPEVATLILYGIFVVFGVGRVRADALSLSPSILFVIFVYVAINLLIMYHSLRRATSISGFAVLNGLAFGLTAWYLTSLPKEGSSWLIPATLFVAGLGAARVTRRYETIKVLHDLYLCQASLAVLLLIMQCLPSGLNLLLMAVFCSLLVFFEKRHGGHLFRITEYGFIGVVFAASFLIELPARSVVFGPFSLPWYWVYVLGTATVFFILARVHYRRACDAENILPDRADAFKREQMLFCAFYLLTAAMLLLVHTILYRNDSEALPLLLAMQGFLYLGLGLVFFQSGVALIGLVPVMAGHACYYTLAFLLPSSATLSLQSRFLQWGVLLFVTLVLALLGDYRMGMRGNGRPLIMERILVLLPYLTFLPVWWLLPFLKDSPCIALAALSGTAGLAGILAPRILRCSMPGLQTLGYLGVAVSLALYLYGIRVTSPPAYGYNGYLPLLGVYLVSLILFERVKNIKVPWACQALSLAIAVLGVLGLYQWNNGHLFALALVGLALLMVLAGYTFTARAYYHTAVLLLASAVLWILFSEVAWASGRTFTAPPQAFVIMLR